MSKVWEGRAASTHHHNYRSGGDEEAAVEGGGGEFFTEEQPGEDHDQGHAEFVERGDARGGA